MRRLLPSVFCSLLFAFTLCVYIPVVSYYANINEFPFLLTMLLQSMLLPFIAVSAAVFFIFFLENRVFPPFTDFRYESKYGNISFTNILLLLAVFCIWLEGFLLNKGLPQLTGAGDIFNSVPRLVLDTGVLVGLLLLVIYFWNYIAKYILFFVSALSLLLALGIADSFLSAQKRFLPTATSYEVLSKSAFHNKDNVVVFLLDALSTALVKDYLKDNPYATRQLEGFIFFENNLETSSNTQWSLPSIIRGDLFTGGPVLQYQRDLFNKQGSLTRKFLKKGYNIYASSFVPMFNTLEDYSTQNEQNKKSFYLSFSPKLYGHLLLRFAPYALKNTIANKTGFSVSAPQNNLHVKKKYYDDTVYSVLKLGVEESSAFRPTFHFHHVHGAHAPYKMGRGCEELPFELHYTLEGLFKQSVWSLDTLLEIFAQMKDKGIYAYSTIVILGDHGDRREHPSRRHNPYSKHAALLIKPAGRKAPFSVSKAPTSNLYLADFISRIHLNNEDIAELTKDLPTTRSLYYPDNSVLQLLQGENVTSLKLISKQIIQQNFTPTPLKEGQKYELYILRKANNPAVPLNLKNADFLNGWGIRGKEKTFEAEFLLAVPYAKAFKAVLLIETITQKNKGVFQEYGLSVKDLVSSKEQPFKLTERTSTLILEHLQADDKGKIRFQINAPSLPPGSEINLQEITLYKKQI